MELEGLQAGRILPGGLSLSSLALVCRRLEEVLPFKVIQWGDQRAARSGPSRGGRFLDAEPTFSVSSVDEVRKTRRRNESISQCGGLTPSTEAGKWTIEGRWH